MVGTRKLRSRKLGECYECEGYVRSLEEKGVEWVGDNKVEHMWEQVKWAMVESAREMCGSVRVGGKNPEVCSGMRK